MTHDEIVARIFDLMDNYSVAVLGSDNVYKLSWLDQQKQILCDALITVLWSEN